MGKMDKFFELVGYEYKKILAQRFLRIMILVSLVVTVIAQLSVFWTFSSLDMERGGPRRAMIADRAYARQIASQPLTADLFIASLDSRPIEPYNEVFRFWVNTRVALRMFEQTPDETREAMEQFYRDRHEQTVGAIGGLYAANLITIQGFEHMIQLNESISEPWDFHFTRGYNRFFTMHLLVSIMVAFIIAVSVAPLFAYEHSTNVAQLILVSKYGKTKLIRAKLFTAISFGMLTVILFFGVSFFVNMFVFGFDGAAAPFQLFDIHSPYPFTMIQAVLVFIAYSMMRTVLLTSVLVLFSAKFKSSFAVMIIAGIWIIAASMIYIPNPTEAWLVNALRLFIHVVPTSSAAFFIMPYQVFGMIIFPFVFEALVAVLMGLTLIPFAGRAFAKHQAG
jgi:hypothetical protein